MTAPALELRKTSLNSVHRAMGGRMVEFGGWDMPVQYPAGTMAEHLRTRTHAGLFDVSHMGEIDVRGADAISFVNRLVSNDATKLIDGQAQYSALTTPEGTVIDDLLVYRFTEDALEFGRGLCPRIGLRAGFRLRVGFGVRLRVRSLLRRFTGHC